MNILFVTNNLYPHLNANSEIAYKLAAVLKENHNCNVTILGYSDKERNNNDNPYHVDEYEMKAIGLGRRIMARRENRAIKFIRLLLHPAALMYVLFPSKNSQYLLKKHYCKAIKKVVHRRNIHCLVCFKNPNDTIAGAIEANLSAPIIAYELDPWENEEGQIDEMVREQQYFLEKNCAAIISTMLLYKTYFESGSRIPPERVSRAEFPNIIEQKMTNASLFTDNMIHCVFTGQLYDDIRNPKFTIDLFSKLGKEGIVLDIFGNDNGCLKNITLPENVIYHGEVMSEDATAYIMSSDVVVNIGNTLMNQMPSKILTYISTGKPILNIIKDKECPTLKYVNKYPLAISVLESDSVTEAIVNEVGDFCRQSRGKAVEFNTIKKMYHEATPEYVGNSLFEVIMRIK